jgi:hypothetical protein
VYIHTYIHTSASVAIALASLLSVNGDKYIREDVQQSPSITSPTLDQQDLASTSSSESQDMEAQESGRTASPINMALEGSISGEQDDLFRALRKIDSARTAGKSMLS